MKKLFAFVLAFVLLASSAFAAEEPSEVDQFFANYRLWLIALGTDPGEYTPYVEQLNDYQTLTCWDAVSVLSNTKSGDLALTDVAVLINGKLVGDDSRRVAAYIAASLCSAPPMDYQKLVDSYNNTVKPVFRNLVSALFDGTDAVKEDVPFHQSEAGFMTASLLAQRTRDMLYVSNVPFAGILFRQKD